MSTSPPPHLLAPTYEVYDLGDDPSVPYAEATDLDAARAYLRTCTGRGVVVRVRRDVVEQPGGRP